MYGVQELTVLPVLSVVLNVPVPQAVQVGGAVVVPAAEM